MEVSTAQLFVIHV